MSFFDGIHKRYYGLTLDLPSSPKDYTKYPNYKPQTGHYHAEDHSEEGRLGPVFKGTSARRIPGQ